MGRNAKIHLAIPPRFSYNGVSEDGESSIACCKTVRRKEQLENGAIF